MEIIIWKGESCVVKQNKIRKQLLKLKMRLNVKSTPVQNLNFVISLLRGQSLLNYWSSPGEVVQLVGAPSHTPKSCGFDSRSGHIPCWGDFGRQLINASLLH